MRRAGGPLGPPASLTARRPPDARLLLTVELMVGVGGAGLVCVPAGPIVVRDLRPSLTGGFRLLCAARSLWLLGTPRGVRGRLVAALDLVPVGAGCPLDRRLDRRLDRG